MASARNSTGMHRGGDDRVFSDVNWARISEEAMYKATAALDRLCKVIINVKAFYPSGPVARSLRNLALTASVFDPLLFAYSHHIIPSPFLKICFRPSMWKLIMVPFLLSQRPGLTA